VTNFPLFELKDDALSSQHHPFTMPDRTDFDPTDREDMLRLYSRAYDLVMNGEELGGGSVRIHTSDVQQKIFQALGLNRQETEAKFGFFLRALEYGTPPHAGLALGMDRVIAMILGVSSIREVIAFPKNRSASCPLTRAPSTADESLLEELGLGSNRGFYPRESFRETGIGAPARERPPSEKITREEIGHVAKLARLRLSDDEVDLYRKDLNAILDYVEALDELDTDNVPPMSHVLDMKNVWREDRPDTGKKSDTLLSNAPEREKDYFKVPRILEG
jgi:aspartyl-tRNA synthetase